jgi:hypothetical protein
VSSSSNSVVNASPATQRRRGLGLAGSCGEHVMMMMAAAVLIVPMTTAQLT